MEADARLFAAVDSAVADLAAGAEPVLTLPASATGRALAVLSDYARLLRAEALAVALAAKVQDNRSAGCEK